jgi:hypothetical protein
MRTALALFALLSLRLGELAQAAEEHGTSKRPNISVQPAGFGRVSSADIQAVLESAMSEILRHCPHARLPDITVYHRHDHPQTNFNRNSDGSIAIGLTAKSTYWAQYSFQFAHEFCHALANFSSNPRRSVRHRKHANFWLEESLCETASLFTLRAMSRSWQNAPPYPAWRNYARWLDAYVEQRIAMSTHQLPNGASFLAWFRENEPALRGNSAFRNRNSIIAIHLLPVFESEPRGWDAVTFLNRGSLNVNGSLAQYLGGWRSDCPPELRPFVSRLAGVFGVKL